MDRSISGSLSWDCVHWNQLGIEIYDLALLELEIASFDDLVTLTFDSPGDSFEGRAAWRTVFKHASKVHVGRYTLKDPHDRFVESINSTSIQGELFQLSTRDLELMLTSPDAEVQPLVAELGVGQSAAPLVVRSEVR